jgi:hypothetical protein
MSAFPGTLPPRASPGARASRTAIPIAMSIATGSMRNSLV